MQIEEGAVLDGRITGITSFGAFADLGEGKSGLIHISEIATTYVEDVNDYLKKGQKVRVKVIGTQDGKISLSMKRVEEERKQARREKKEKREKRPPKRFNRPPEEFEFEKPGEELSFDDMLQKFKKDSDEKFRDLKRSNDNKRSGGYKRTY